jgi:hypothetical protein
VEIWDWFDDLGDAFRSSDRKVARIDRAVTARGGHPGTPPLVGCLWVVRATRRNRALVAQLSTTFRARFPGSNAAWVAALTDAAAPMPTSPGFLWISVDGRRLWAARFAPTRPGTHPADRPADRPR